MCAQIETPGAHAATPISGAKNFCIPNPSANSLNSPTEMWAGGREINFVVNLERFARPVVRHFVFQANPAVPGTTDMSFAFNVEVVVRAGESDYAATAGAQPNQAVTAQRVNVDPKCTFTFDCRPPTPSS
jgi:hypothetical protein